MLEFFIALFGSLYYGGRYVGEKASSKPISHSTDLLIMEMRSDEMKWESEVIDNEFEYNVRSKVTNWDEDADEMYLKIEAECPGVPVSTDMVIMGLMAQRGKIPREIARRGIKARGLWNHEETLAWHTQRKFLQWYDNELRKNGLQEKMLFVKGGENKEVYRRPELGIPLQQCTSVIGGIYFWYPIRGEASRYY